MTTEVFQPTPVYTISGVGPYAIRHPYRHSDDIALSVLVDDVLVQLGPELFTVFPEVAAVNGDVVLRHEAAVEHEGRKLYIYRMTTAEQGWSGIGGAREKGLEHQLDVVTMALQETQEKLDRAIVLPSVGDTPLTASLQPDRALMASPDGKTVVPGPNVEEIGQASEKAEIASLKATEAIAAADRAEAAEASITKLYPKSGTIAAADNTGDFNTITIAGDYDDAKLITLTQGGLTLARGIDYRVVSDGTETVIQRIDAVGEPLNFTRGHVIEWTAEHQVAVPVADPEAIVLPNGKSLTEAVLPSYPQRGQLKADWNAGYLNYLPDGSVLWGGVRAYKIKNGDTTIPDMHGLYPLYPVSHEHFGGGEAGQALASAFIASLGFADLPDFIMRRPLITDTGWNPDEEGVRARSTPERALLPVGGHYSHTGSAGRRYFWGIQAWMTNGETAPTTGVDSVGQGFKTRGIGATARQMGDDGDGHAMEALIGQLASQAKVDAVVGSAVLTVTDTFLRGSRFCVGNAISGDNIPANATIVSVTQDGQTVTHEQVLSADVADGGSGYVVGDEVFLEGGTFTYPAQVFVRTVLAGAVTSVLVIDYGNYSARPDDTTSTSGGLGTGLTLEKIAYINGGFGNPDTITISAPATATGNSSIKVLSADTLGVGLLITGSGDGGSDGTGNPNGRAIQVQSYGEAAFKKGFVLGPTSLRDGSTGIEFSPEKRMDDGILFNDVHADYAVRVQSGFFEQEIFRFNGAIADAGLWFNSSCNFAFGALYLDGQAIRTSTTLGMNVCLNPAEKLGFWGTTPIAQPDAIAPPSGGSVIDVECRSKLIELLDKITALGLTK